MSCLEKNCTQSRKQVNINEKTGIPTAMASGQRRRGEGGGRKPITPFVDVENPSNWIF